MTADGFSLSDTRTPVEENDIPEILRKWPTREDGPNSFRIGRAELRKFGDELIPGRYRTLEQESVIHDSPSIIVGELLDTEKKIASKLLSIRELLAKK
jgi:type I restriction enzyme M protein